MTRSSYRKTACLWAELTNLCVLLCFKKSKPRRVCLAINALIHNQTFMQADCAVLHASVCIQISIKVRQITSVFCELLAWHPMKYSKYIAYKTDVARTDIIAVLPQVSSFTDWFAINLDETWFWVALRGKAPQQVEVDNYQLHRDKWKQYIRSC